MKKTLRNRINTIKIAKPIKLNLKEIILLIDTTYWGLNFGVVVFKDAISNKFIWWHFIEQKLEDYKLGFKWCVEQGYIIKAVVSRLSGTCQNSLSYCVSNLLHAKSCNGKAN